MKLENQVVSLPIAKRLKELGVRQESYFWYYEVFGGTHTLAPFNKSGNETYSAFTVAELGEILPDAIASYRYKTEDEDPDEWACIKYVKGEHSKYEHVVHAPTEADARGAMIIHLLEQGLIKLEK